MEERGSVCSSRSGHLFLLFPLIAALRVNVLANDIKIRDIAGSHSFNGGTTTEDPRLVRLMYPLICSLWEKDLQSFVYPQEVVSPYVV